MSNVFGARAVSSHEMNRLAAAIDGSFMFPSAAGGAVTPSSGLTVAVAAITGSMVTIGSTLVGTGYAGGTVTATAAHATLARRDLVYYDTSGAVGISAGTPAATPHVPTLTSTQIAVAELYVAATATVINAGDINDRRQQVIGSKRVTAMATYPAAPSVGTTVASSASANTYGSWTEMVASTSAAVLLLGVSIDSEVNSIPQYILVDVGTGAGGSESSLGVHARFQSSNQTAGAGPLLTPVAEYVFPMPIAVAASTRIAARSATAEATSNNIAVTLKYALQSNIVTF